MGEVSPIHGIEYDCVGEESAKPDEPLVQPKSRMYLKLVISAGIVVLVGVAVFAACVATGVYKRYDPPTILHGSSSSDLDTYVQPTEVPSPGGGLYSTAFAAPDPIWDDVIAAPMSPPLRIYGDAKVQMQIVPIGGRTASKPFPGVCTIAKGGVLRLYGNKPKGGMSYTAIEYIGSAPSAPPVSGECPDGTLFQWNESTMADSFD